MENNVTIFEKLLMIQAKLKAPKNQYNDFSNFNYRSCEDILEAVKPLLVDTQTVLILSDEIVQAGDHFYIKAIAKLVDTVSKEFVENTAFAREAESKKGMDSAQITGSASSYARKYALNGLFAIDDTKDSDYTNNGKDTQSHSKGQNKKSLHEYKQEIAQLLKVKNVEPLKFVEWLKKNYKVDKIDGMSVSQLEKIKANIASW